MEANELARQVAKDLGGDMPDKVEAEIDRHRERSFGLSESISLAGFVVSCVSLALQYGSGKKSRAVVVADLRESAPKAAGISEGDREKVIQAVARKVAEAAATSGP